MNAALTKDPSAIRTIKLIILILSLCHAMSGAVMAENIEKIAKVRMVYWHLLHGKVEQVLGTDASGKLFMTTYVFDAENPENKKPVVTTKEIGEETLKTIQKFVNDPDIRTAFLKTEIQVQPDGSGVELTVQQNGFGLIFVSQKAFGANAPTAHKRLGALALGLLKEAGISLP
jgi:hypothetical protein